MPMVGDQYVMPINVRKWYVNFLVEMYFLKRLDEEELLFRLSNMDLTPVTIEEWPDKLVLELLNA